MAGNASPAQSELRLRRGLVGPLALLIPETYTELDSSSTTSLPEYLGAVDAPVGRRHVGNASVALQPGAAGELGWPRMAAPEHLSLAGAVGRLLEVPVERYESLRSAAYHQHRAASLPVDFAKYAWRPPDPQHLLWQPCLPQPPQPAMHHVAACRHL